METVIKENKYQFLNLFMDHGIHMKWTKSMIKDLLKETVKQILIKIFKYLKYKL